MPLTVRGTVLQTPEPTRLEAFDDVRVVVDDGGTITSVGWDDDGPPDVTLPDGAYLLPGLVDTHVHAPQWPQLGTGLDLPLARWLDEYTFPLEARYADHDFAQRVWTDLVDTLVAHGTTTAAYYATVDLDATTMLAETCVAAGQRALVGRVAMDHPDLTPPAYRDPSPVAAVEASAKSVDAIRALDAGRGRVAPVVTPRFVPACTDELLSGLGELAAETGAIVQTHCSESDWQHQHVIERFGTTDASVLDSFGLLRPHTVLAHGPHLTPADVERVLAAGAGVAHCPESNAYFANAVLPARRLLERGLPLGLGSDVSGGPHPGMLRQAAAAVTASRYLRDGVDPRLRSEARGDGGAVIDVVAGFWMATLGGAELLGLPVGLLAPGRRFDAVVVETNRAGSPLRVWGDLDGPERVFEKIVRLAGADDVRTVWVDGVVVKG